MRLSNIKVDGLEARIQARVHYRQFTVNRLHMFLLEFKTERSLRGCQV